jgi:hypothetical protein
MPVERPNVLNRDSIGKHGAVAVELKLINERDNHERD